MARYGTKAQKSVERTMRERKHGTLRSGLNRRENHDRIEQELLQNIELAAANNIPGLICFTGDRYDGKSDDECLDISAEGLSRVTMDPPRSGTGVVAPCRWGTSLRSSFPALRGTPRTSQTTASPGPGGPRAADGDGGYE